MRRLPLLLGLLTLVLLSLGFEWEGRLGRLRRELEAADPARRREVVRLLSSYSADEVRDALLGALSDPDPGVRAEAADAVGKVRLREAVPRLLDWLDDADADVRASAARALGRIGHRRAVPSLVRALGDAHAHVRRAAVEALAAIGMPEVVVPLLGRLDDQDPSVRIDAARALGRLGDERAVVPLVGRARDDSIKVRVAVFEALGEIGDERGVSALLQALREGPTEAQLAAVGALGRLRAPSAVEPLRALVEETDPRVARAAVAALGAIAGHEAIDIVITALADHRTRETAQDVLVAAAHRRRSPAVPGAWAPLLATALDRATSPQHATALAEVIARIATLESTREAAPALLRALRTGRGDPETVMRALAMTSSPDALVPLLEGLASEDPEVRKASLAAVEVYFDHVAPDGRAADPLLSALGRVEPEQRARVVRLLGRIGVPRALPSLRPLLDHPDTELRLTAVGALGAIGDAHVAPALVALLRDRDARTRFAAAEALASAATPETVADLVERFGAREPVDRHAVALALGGALANLSSEGSVPQDLADRARRNLLRAATGTDLPLAARAVDALVRWGAPGAAASLTELLDSPHPPLRRQVALALGAFDTPEALEALRELVTAADTPLQAAAAGALGEHGTADDARVLLSVAARASWPVPAAASFSLARLARRGVLDDANAGDPLCQLARSRDPYVRANAGVALAAVGGHACPDGEPDPRRWLGPRHAAAVRVAAVRWLAAMAEHRPSRRTGIERLLEQCIQTELAPEVSDVCRDPAWPPLDDEADVYAYGSDGRTVLADRPVALRLADGTVMVARTDVNGHLRLRRAPPGPLVLDDPITTPLEP